MFGPKPMGFWSGVKAPNHREQHGPLTAGRRYRVVREFRDYDGDVHPVGETWLFCGTSFLPYDDGVSLFVSLDGQQEWHIRLQQRPEEQAAVLDALEQYVVLVETPESLE